MTQLGHWRERLSPVWRGALFYFGYWGVVGIFNPFINVYFAHLGFSGRQIGLLAALFPLMTFAVAPALAALADRRARRTQVLAGAVASLVVTLFLMRLADTFAMMVVLVALISLARSPIAPIGDGLVTRMAVHHHLDYGRMRRWGALSFALAALAGGPLWQRVGYGPMFLVAGLLLIPVLFAALLLDEGSTSVAHEGVALSTALRDRSVVAILIASSLMGAALSMDGTFAGIFVDQLGGGALLVGIVTSVAGFSQFPAMQYGDTIIRRLRGAPTLLLACALMGFGYAGYAFASHPGILVGLAMFKGFGFGIFFIGAVRLLNDHAPAAWATTVQALLQAGAWGLAPLLAGPLSGIIFDAWGARAVFLTSTVLMVLAGGVVLMMPERKAALRISQD